MSTTDIAAPFVCPDARYVRLRPELDGYRPEFVADGSVRAAEDIEHPETRERLMTKIAERGGAYPRGFSIEVTGGKITGMWGSI